jgi:formylglycine-generating enzyme required for sulfatase activity
MVCIPAGPFVRGRDDGPADERPAARVELSTYFIDRFEVTFADYQRCAAQGRCPRARPQYTDYDHPAMPMTGVSWFDADAYCRAQGKALPSEAQWEKAARGPNGALQPWGDEPATCERAVIKDAAGRGCGLRKRFSQPEKGRPWDVGSRPAGSYGLHDMVGNAWEWVADWYAPSFGECGDACAGVDPLGPCAAAPTCPGARRRVVRGGSWYWDASYATATRRRAHSPANVPFHHFGFRCAASPEQAAAFAGR